MKWPWALSKHRREPNERPQECAVKLVEDAEELTALRLLPRMEESFAQKLDSSGPEFQIAAANALKLN